MLKITGKPRLSEQLIGKNCLNYYLLIIFSYVAISCQYSHCETIKFTLSATDLPNRDVDGVSDPIARFWKAEGKSKSFHRVGETEKIDNNPNPVWEKIFTFRYANGTNQRWRFFIKDWDLDCLWLFEDVLGKAEINVDDYMEEVSQSKGEKHVELVLTHPSGGILNIHPIVENKKSPASRKYSRSL